ncbi:hypothetical protein [Aestuariispira insulae]|uniref:Uncharacterized protein n=1 Tax=Aestuariispira insulae TaxID=1461337 RepID=A0A3D9HRU7_9PROT|nr:hypothetical protein [Aestuariispira insulae]RED51586.1 hypothetical protein DFP90_103389 [Aestuariispira insulae]
MKKILTAIAALTFSFSAQAANEWGIEGEEKARFDAKVVDILCELTGNCPDNCGDGKRQLGLLKEDGTLVMVAKNFDPFAGGADDLAPHCGKKITADGLMITTAHMPIFAIQFTRPEGGKWKRANAFGQNWSQANGGKKAGQWFRSDATVKALIEQDGVFGIPGLEPEE